LYAAVCQIYHSLLNKLGERTQVHLKIADN